MGFDAVNPQAEHTLLDNVLRGDADAVALCTTLFRVSQIVDDLYDADVAVDGETIQRLAWMALVELPGNTFYIRHRETLAPRITGALMDWIDSTALERSGDHDQSLAFVLRDSLTGVVSHCAYLIGGYAWMKAISPSIRRAFHDETLTDYIETLAHSAKEAP